MQKYPLFLENSYCSNLHYSCVLDKKALLDEKDKGATRNLEIISSLESKVSNCERQIETYCNTLGGSDALVQKTVKDKNGASGQYIIKIKLKN